MPDRLARRRFGVASARGHSGGRAAALALLAAAACSGGSPDGSATPLERWDDNGNGRITCAEARRHGIAPVHRGHPAYPYMRDANADGVVCAPRSRSRSGRSAAPPDPSSPALERWDDNGNGRITCAEARRHGIAPVRRGHAAYPYMRDANNDGVICA